MDKHLYFVCPTDNLETIIENNFQNENYYLSSLGNSIAFDPEIIDEINSLVKNIGITRINFVLSDDNELILDGLYDEKFDKIDGLKNFYDIIKIQKKQTEHVWNKWDSRIPIITHFLNLKIQELNLQLKGLSSNNIKVVGKIYKTKANIFRKVQAKCLLDLEKFTLN